MPRPSEQRVHVALAHLSERHEQGELTPLPQPSQVGPQRRAAAHLVQARCTSLRRGPRPWRRRVTGRRTAHRVLRRATVARVAPCAAGGTRASERIAEPGKLSPILAPQGIREPSGPVRSAGRPWCRICAAHCGPKVCGRCCSSSRCWSSWQVGCSPPHRERAPTMATTSARSGAPTGSRTASASRISGPPTKHAPSSLSHCSR